MRQGSDHRYPQSQARGKCYIKKETRDAKGIKRKGRSYVGQERLPGGGEVKVGLEGQI